MEPGFSFGMNSGHLSDLETDRETEGVFFSEAPAIPRRPAPAANVTVVNEEQARECAREDARSNIATGLAQPLASNSMASLIEEESVEGGTPRPDGKDQEERSKILRALLRMKMMCDAQFAKERRRTREELRREVDELTGALQETRASAALARRENQTRETEALAVRQYSEQQKLAILRLRE